MEALQEADSVKTIKIEELKAKHKSSQELLTNELRCIAIKLKRISKIPDTNQSQLEEKSEKTKKIEEMHMIPVLAAMRFSFCIWYTPATQDLHVQGGSKYACHT